MIISGIGDNLTSFSFNSGKNIKDTLYLSDNMNYDAWVSGNGGIDPCSSNNEVLECRFCQQKFKLIYNNASGFREREEYYCPNYKKECGTVMASDIPQTEAFEPDSTSKP